jgi:beta-aspartyl-peptidase (threonine type)
MRRTIAALFLLLTVASASAAFASRSSRDEIQALLRAQAEAWTRGDLDAFCSVYADDATFISPSGMTHGRRAVLDRYRDKYEDKAAMGALTLEVLETRSLGSPQASSVIARWTLTWPDKPKAEGLTLLVFTRTKDGWRILQDASM